MRRLTVRYDNDPDDELGKLWFSIEAERFSGSGFFWSNLTEFPEILEQLDRYPLDAPLVWHWGFGEVGALDPALSLEVHQISPKGDLQARISIADLDDTEQRVCAKMKVDYASLAEFRLQLAKLVEYPNNEVAVLNGFWI